MSEHVETIKMLQQGIDDMIQWIVEAPTPEAKKYRNELVADAFSGKRLQLKWRHIESNEGMTKIAEI